ncbi:NAD-glutamate dehydrogenase [Nisaea acidiphila]|uniref:NAD-glutamate dehydrogenase n=1 Tax=Nisaea acidiphila TaxID=1862145 RepID=A0A9J7ALE3_9PROT|nr:NAD-glutamate dehydrogenase [Nisaea acidiphila]UUX47982.1 NAD-glutamate dehydrogenase [Nisaea acidiphila]
MRDKLHTLKQELIDRLIADLQERIAKDKQAEAESFVRQFYANVAPQDILSEEPEDLLGAVLSVWEFGKLREPGKAKIRAYNPRFDSTGWQSPHTVIEIVNDDMPFLVDSVTTALNSQDLTVHLVIHPIFAVERSSKGELERVLDSAAPGNGELRESYMQFRISEQSSATVLERIEQDLHSLLQDVRSSVEDWRTMREKVLDVVTEIGVRETPHNREEVSEVVDFLRWIEDNHFTFLGYRELDYVGSGKTAKMQVVDGSGLGILRSPEVGVFDGLRNLGELPEDVRVFLTSPDLLLIMKANHKARVHRPVHMDAIIVKKIDNHGKVTGEHRFIGLFTSVAYNQSPSDIPLLRQKISHIVARAGFAPDSHNGKALLNILETYPRDELFQATEDELLTTSIGILHLQERQKTALFIRADPFERFISAILFVPRDHYNTPIRERFADILGKAFNGSITAFYTQVSESVLARLHFIVKTERGAVPEVDLEELEHRLADAARSWSDKLHQALVEARGEERGNALLRRYRNAFPSSYREDYSAQGAIFDIDRIEETLSDGRLAINLFRPVGSEDRRLHLKFFHRDTPVPLSDVMPMIENMGVRVLSERPYEVSSKFLGNAVWIHDFEMQMKSSGAVDVAKIRRPFHDAFEAVWTGKMEDDGFNILVLQAGLTWREVAMLRAYAKYLRQAAFTFSQDYMEETLAENAAIAQLLAQLFDARFDPSVEDSQRIAESERITAEIEAALDNVANLDQDRIIRRYLNLIQSTMRTNYYQPDESGSPKPYISFKLDSQSIDDLPLPRPLVEIWVYSPRAEAVHLRGGRVARGGIRWSDRREDFRTEILGLMKAQQVKNAVIVPVGSKGGFVVKRPPVDGTREEMQAEAIECYKTMMRGMLDITDNISGADIIPPELVVRHDEDDPYLVVAADKGTATFSDIANGVSQDYGFWLDDAFASGGSAGYDHKKMGITAKGAWESVKRHFREIGVDIQTTDFSVVGVGDMSGDVFGNGMLLSKHIKLVGAFNHMHIFFDPTPDAAKSWAERKRLFDLPRSAWTDYDEKLISKGGGIYPRSAKSIDVTAEMKSVLGIKGDKITPNDLIRAMLMAKVDLLWFGGIGTYIKESGENNLDAGDRANDALRINASEVGAKVVGEGANLGVTQRARIEFALKGGRINTDAIDNSAGVDCSDHEVNIKILLGGVVTEGDMTRKQRDKLLEEMTDEVADLVLKDNYDQSQALTMAQVEGTALLDAETRLIRELERSHLKLNRDVEFLPDDETLAERMAAGSGLTRPELAVLLAYAKMELYDEILPSELPDDPMLAEDLVRYFPARLHKGLSEVIREHRLKREIIATYVSNSMINRVGATFVNAVREQTGDGSPDIARAYIVARDVFAIRQLWSAVEALDNKVSAEVQTEMLLDIKHLVERAAVWFLRNERRPLDLQSLTGTYIEGIAELTQGLDKVLTDTHRKAVAKKAAKHEAAGVPKELARGVAGADILVSGCDIVRLSRQTGETVPRVAEVYFALGNQFSIDWLRERADQVVAESHWQKMAVSAVVDDLYNHQFQLAQNVLAECASGKSKKASAAKLIGKWTDSRKEASERMSRLLADLRAADGVDLSMLAVANGQFRSLLAH